MSKLLIELQKTKNRSSRSQVLIPGYTCYSVAAAVVRAGLKIVCYDLDPFTLEPVMNSIRDMIGKETLAIVGQHLFGIPADLDELANYARSNGSYFIENAAQSFGGTRMGRHLGTLGDYGIFSFGRGKSLPLGSGGALIGDEGVLKKISMNEPSPGYLNLLRTFMNRVLSNRRVYGILEALPLGLGQTIFDTGFPIAPMPVTLKRLGIYSLLTLKDIHKHRSKIGRIYHKKLGERVMARLLPESQAVFTRFPVRASSKQIPNELIRLGARRMYPKAILDEQSIQSYCIRNNTPTPGSSRIAETLITLPTHTGISEQKAEEILDAVRGVAW